MNNHYLKKKLSAVALSVVLGTAALPTFAQTCDQLLNATSEALASNSKAQVLTAINALQTDTTCNEQTLTAAKRQASAALAGLAQEQIDAGNTQAALDLINQAPATHWAIQALRGDMAAARNDRSEAAQMYNAAIDTITDASLTEQSEELNPIISQLAKLARENIMLAGNMSAAVSRGGEPTGLMKLATKGITFETANTTTTPGNDNYSSGNYSGGNYSGGNYNNTPTVTTVNNADRAVFLPIRFAFNSDKLDQAGKNEAKRIASFLKTNYIASIALHGHTDDIGEASYNMDLSIRRANSLKNFLVNKGVTTQINVQGFGESQPPDLSDQNLYDAKQKRTIARRVELVFY